jgi:hypothetical protein
MSEEQNLLNSHLEMWQPDQNEIGFDLGTAAENIMIAAGIRVYCNSDPFRIDCMRVTAVVPAGQWTDQRSSVCWPTSTMN